jgi:hypothetical protein
MIYPAGIYEDLGPAVRPRLNRDADKLSVDEFSERYGLLIRARYARDGHRVTVDEGCQAAVRLWHWLRASSAQRA